MSEAAALLPPGAVDAYNRDGFYHVPQAYQGQALADLIAWTDALAAAPEETGREWKYFETSALDGTRLLNRIENFAPYHAGFNRLLTEGALPQAVSTLIGEPAVLFKDKINCKMRGGGGFEAHQDVQAGWSTYAGRHISVLIAIDPMTPENGCLEVLPAVHKAGLLGDMWAPLTEAQADPNAFVTVPCAPGDLLFFDSYTPHRSGPNQSTATRRAAYLTYNAASEGDSRARYYADKYANYPPDIDRAPDRDYGYKV
jgi:hypothetical protein